MRGEMDVILGAQMSDDVQTSLRVQQVSPQENCGGRQQVLKSGLHAGSKDIVRIAVCHLVGRESTYLDCLERAMRNRPQCT